MGKRSVRKDKNIYQICRENAGLTREKASDMIGWLSDDRIEKIESGRSGAHPDEVLAMAKCYHAPQLPNYYCSHTCPIGREYVPEIPMKDLPTITLELLTALNALAKEKDRMIEIASDGKINPGEEADFDRIRTYLSRVTVSSQALSLWLEQTENQASLADKAD